MQLKMIHLFPIFQNNWTFANSLSGKKNIESSPLLKKTQTKCTERNPNRQSQPPTDTHAQTERR